MCAHAWRLMMALGPAAASSPMPATKRRVVPCWHPRRRFTCCCTVHLPAVYCVTVYLPALQGQLPAAGGEPHGGARLQPAPGAGAEGGKGQARPGQARQGVKVGWRRTGRNGDGWMEGAPGLLWTCRFHRPGQVWRLAHGAHEGANLQARAPRTHPATTLPSTLLCALSCRARLGLPPPAAGFPPPCPCPWPARPPLPPRSSQPAACAARIRTPAAASQCCQKSPRW